EELRREKQLRGGRESRDVPEVFAKHSRALSGNGGPPPADHGAAGGPAGGLGAPAFRSRSMRSTSSVALKGLDMKSSACDFSRQYSSLLPVSRVIAVSMRMGIVFSFSSFLSDWQTSNP